MSQAKLIQEWAENNNVTLSSVFVPFSTSRNRLENHPSLNYIVVLQCGKHSINTEYMKGCGHIPLKTLSNNDHKSVVEREKNQLIKYCCENGKFPHAFRYSNIKPKNIIGKPVKFPIPTVDEVLYSLYIDSDVLNYRSFSEWAESFGYDDDSIKAREIYDACQKIAVVFDSMFSKQQKEELQELLQDY